jgi:hypothetical protein
MDKKQIRFIEFCFVNWTTFQHTHCTLFELPRLKGRGNYHFRAPDSEVKQRQMQKMACLVGGYACLQKLTVFKYLNPVRHINDKLTIYLSS